MATTRGEHGVRRTAARCLAGLSVAMALGGASGKLAQAQETPPAIVLFENVRVFDGRGGALSAPSSVLVRGNRIATISAAPMPLDRPADTLIIAGGGRTLMPGLIDAHTHMTLSTVPLAVLLTADPNYIMLRQGKAAGEMLMRGSRARATLAATRSGSSGRSMRASF